MSTLKTSISILALATGLAIGFAPQASLAQDANWQKVVKKAEDTGAKADRIQRDGNTGQARDKSAPATPDATNKPAEMRRAKDAKGKPITGFDAPPEEAKAAEAKPEEPNPLQKCWKKFCRRVAKFFGSEDQAETRQTYREDLHRQSAERRTEEGRKTPEQEPAARPETKKAETPAKPAQSTPAKPVETGSAQPEAPRTKAVEVRPAQPEAPRAKAVETRTSSAVIPTRAPDTKLAATSVMPVVIPARAPVATAAVQPTTTVNIARAPTVTPTVTPTVRPATPAPNVPAAIVNTTVGRISIATGPTIATPRIATPAVTQVAMRR